MTLPRPHSAYREVSGLGLSAIPAHWSISPLRYLIRQIQSGVSVNAVDVQAGPDDVTVLKTSSVYSGEFDLSQSKVVVEEDLERVACSVAAGQLIVSRMNTPALVGAAGYSAVEAPNTYLPDRLWQIDFRSVSARFVHRWTQTAAYRDQVSAVTAGTSSSMHNLAQDDFKSFLLAFPPMDEQSAIVEFLARETAEVDGLIAKQELLIETLSERRQAVISHAVTKGLNPNAPMKETGSAWFPSIPASWDLVPAGSASTLIQTGPFGSQLHADEYVSGGTPVINPSHIIDGQIAPNESVTVDEGRARELVRHQLRVGDIVVARRGEMGRCAAVGRASAGFLCGTGSLIVRLRSEAYVAAYFQLIFSSDANRAALTERSIGATMDNLNGDIVARLRLPRPSIYEQQEIIEYLDQETAQIDALSAKAHEMIDVLKERRQALISAAVTGKIDVRDLG